MPIVFGAIAPHGFPIIPELSDDAEGALLTRAAMVELGRRFDRSGADVIVIAGPHGVRVDGAVALANVSRGAGTLFWNDRQVEMNIPVDGGLTGRIAQLAHEEGVPVAMTGYAGNRRDESVIPLDWGTITPLWFLGYSENMVGKGHPLAVPPSKDTGAPVVIVSPSRMLPRQTLIDFGHAVADAAMADGRRVAFIASCDWSHRHREEGSYGFHESAAVVDNAIVDAIERESLLDLLELSDEDAQTAVIDGLWQVLMLQGVLERTPLRAALLSYEAPSYYGMIVASYEPLDSSRRPAVSSQQSAAGSQ